MASFKATVEVNGVTFNLLHFNYKLIQTVDAMNKPSGVQRGGICTCLIETSKDDSTITEQAYNSWNTADFVIDFKKTDVDASAKKVEFLNAYVISYEENFEATGSNPSTIRFSVSAEIVKTGNSELHNDWPKG